MVEIGAQVMWKLKLCSGCGRDGRKCAVEKMKLEGEGPVFYTLLGYNKTIRV